MAHRRLFCGGKLWVSILIWTFVFFIPPAIAGQKEDSGPLRLVHAVMCEEVKDGRPDHQAVVFSLGLGEVFCFTAFDPVPAKTFVYHRWFHRDRISTRVRLSLQPPRWSTYSKIQLRADDRGPWRVEVTDSTGTVLQTLRFSITD